MMLDSDSDDNGDAGSHDGADGYGIIHNDGCHDHDSGHDHAALAWVLAPATRREPKSKG